jgi:hypothetical protein
VHLSAASARRPACGCSLARSSRRSSLWPPRSRFGRASKAVHHRDDNTEYVPPPKRTDRGPRHSIKVRICHTHHVTCLECIVDENYQSSSDTIVAKHGAFYHDGCRFVNSLITSLPIHFTYPLVKASQVWERPPSSTRSSRPNSPLRKITADAITSSSTSSRIDLSPFPPLFPISRQGRAFASHPSQLTIVHAYTHNDPIQVSTLNQKAAFVPWISVDRVQLALLRSPPPIPQPPAEQLPSWHMTHTSPSLLTPAALPAVESSAQNELANSTRRHLSW